MTSGQANRPLMYHYTSLNAARAIIESQSIWVSHISDLVLRQDPFEYDFGLKMVRLELLRQRREVPFNDIPPQRQPREQGFYDYALKQVEQIVDEPLGIASFSLRGDDADQWKYYGDRGLGVALGFDERIVRWLFHELTALDSPFWLIPCVYDSDGHRGLAERAIRAMKGIWKPIWDHGGSVGYGRKGWHSDALDRVVLAAIAAKHPNFASEQELRLVQRSMEGWKHPEFTTDPDSQKMYCPVSLAEQHWSMRLREIIVGPRAQLERVRDELAPGLRSAGINPAVRPSQISVALPDNVQARPNPDAVVGATPCPDQ